jgi:hypothetical protein
LADRTLCRHIRRVEQMARSDGTWGHRCDCGWTGAIETVDPAGRKLTKREIEDALERLFVTHLPFAERRAYLLLDTRPVPNPRDPNGGMMNAGNFLMPEGVPVNLLCYEDRGGIYFGHYTVPEEPGEHELIIGEVRNPDGRVFRLDT